MTHAFRRLESIEDYRACVALQEATWGDGFSERVPPAILKVGQLLGGVSAGAWAPDGTLDGFVFGLTGVRDGRIVHWSDMLAVRDPLRDSGLGSRLKAYQRELLLADGVDTMYWTFDPLQSRNAWVNLRKLGAVVREYARDMYGQTDSPLHRGIGTDRFVALWHMDSERVEGRMAGTATDPVEPADAAAALDAGWAAGADRLPHSATPVAPFPQPGDPRPGLDAEYVTVAIPGNATAIIHHEPALALRWREATRAVLSDYLGRGWQVEELFRHGAVSRYLLRRVDAESEPTRKDR